MAQEIRPVPQISEMTENFDVNKVEPGDWQIVPQKPNFWKISGSYSLQFMQNYVSDNWYKGGESNHSMLAMTNLSLVYNNKQKLKFENYLDLKLGFQYYKSDKMHRYRTNSDLIRMTNKLGLQALNFGIIHSRCKVGRSSIQDIKVMIKRCFLISCLLLSLYFLWVWNIN